MKRPSRTDALALYQLRERMNQILSSGIKPDVAPRPPGAEEGGENAREDSPPSPNLERV